MSRLSLASVALIALTLIALLATPAVAQTCTEETAAIFAAMETVAALDVPIENALLVELASAMTGLATGDADALVSDLEAFINKVEKQSGKQIDETTADELIAFAQNILNPPVQCPCANDFELFFSDIENNLVGVDFGLGAVESLSTYVLQPYTLGLALDILALQPVYALGIDEVNNQCIYSFFDFGFPFFPTIPLTSSAALETTEEVEACQSLMDSYFADLGCPDDPAFVGPCANSFP